MIRKLLPTLYQLTGVVITLLAVLAGIGAYAAVDRLPPRIDLMGHPAKTEFRQGEQFEGVRYVTVQRECAGRSVRWVTKEDDPRWVMQLPDASLYYNNAGEGPLPRRIRISVASFPIPHDMEPGNYAYHVRGTFFCNWAQVWLNWPIAVDAPVIEFVVTPDVARDPRRDPPPGANPLPRRRELPAVQESPLGGPP